MVLFNIHTKFKQNQRGRGG